MTTREDISGTTTGNLTYDVSLSYQGEPLDLSTVTTVNAHIKPTATSADSSGKTYTVGSGLTVTNSAGGQLTWTIPAGDVGSNAWYRVDVVDLSSNPNPVAYGRLIITPV